MSKKIEKMGKTGNMQYFNRIKMYLKRIKCTF